MAATGKICHVRVLEQPVSCQEALRAVSNPQAGAVALFLGTVRNHHDGKEVRFLEYEAYPAMAEQKMHQIATEMHDRWPLEAVWMEHRLGRLEIEDISVVVCVSSAHREEAFAACCYGIDRLKQDVPIWKKEHYADGAVWVGETGTAHEAAQPDHGYWTEHPP